MSNLQDNPGRAPYGADIFPSMRTMAVESFGPVETDPLVLRDAPLPEPGAGEIRLRIQACGVCRTDLHVVEGELEPKRAGVVPGHQVIGRVDALGPGATEFRVGDRAGACWLWRTCGTCGYCLSGRENLCEQARFTGLHRDGGYADAMILPASHAIPLPESLDPMRAAPLLCAGVIGYRSLKACGVGPGETLGLFGFGASAHLTLQAAQRRDCPVYVFTRDEEHRKQALGLGARWAGTLEETPPVLLHAAITFAPSGGVVARALSRLRRGGSVAINAVHMDDIPPIPYAALYHERVLRSVANLTRADVREFLDLEVQEPFRVAVNVFPLEDANLALRKVKTSAFQGSAVLAVAGD